MITKEQDVNKKCLFCVSDYHLEMILLPYIIEKKDEYKTIVFTESNLEDSINVLLTKVNLKDEDKEIIKNIDWNKNDSLKFKQIEEIKDNKLNIIINAIAISLIFNFSIFIPPYNIEKYLAFNYGIKTFECFYVFFVFSCDLYILFP